MEDTWIGSEVPPKGSFLGDASSLMEGMRERRALLRDDTALDLTAVVVAVVEGVTILVPP